MAPAAADGAAESDAMLIDVAPLFLLIALGLTAGLLYGLLAMWGRLALLVCKRPPTHSRQDVWGLVITLLLSTVILPAWLIWLASHPHGS
jgi:hypothetical protein